MIIIVYLGHRLPQDSDGRMEEAAVVDARDVGGVRADDLVEVAGGLELGGELDLRGVKHPRHEVAVHVSHEVEQPRAQQQHAVDEAVGSQALVILQFPFLNIPLKSIVKALSLSLE